MKTRLPRRLQYGSEPEQCILLYPSDFQGDTQRSRSGEEEASALLIFVHGGAWRSGSVDDHVDLAEYISSHANITVALIEYRLTLEEKNDVCHPDHISDVHAGLKLLWDDKTRSEFNYACSRSIMVGHSAGGWMTLSAALESERAASSPEMKGPIKNFPAIDPHIRKSLKAFVAVSSIFSLVELAEVYLSYSSFIVPAFYPVGSRQGASAPYSDLAKAGVEAWPVASPGSYTSGHDDQPRIHVIHSAEDDLLSTEYNLRGIFLLKAKGLKPVIDSTSFKGKHDELLHTVPFWRRLVDIVYTEAA